MSLDGRAGLNDQISREAAEWLVELRTEAIDAAGRRDFDAWLRASPEHIRAFIEMAALWHEGGAIDPKRQLDVEAIIAGTQSEQTIVQLNRAARTGSTVSVLPVDQGMRSRAAQASQGKAKNRRARAAGWAAAASVLVVMLAGMILRYGAFGPPIYTTGVRQRRSLVLPDGSKVLLDSKSRLRVAFTATTRTVDLLQGQALFSVVKNPRRPFLVHTGDTIVRDVGTIFDVNRLGKGAIITVVEGRVTVATPPAAQDDAAPTPPESSPDSGSARTGTQKHLAEQPVPLSAGEQLDVQVGHVSQRPTHVDVSSETAWTHGEVVLEHATLTRVARVFNRYSTRRLVAKDFGKKPLRLSGVFSTNPTFLIDYLRDRPDIVVTESGSEVDIVRNPSY